MTGPRDDLADARFDRALDRILTPEAPVPPPAGLTRRLLRIPDDAPPRAPGRRVALPLAAAAAVLLLGWIALAVREAPEPVPDAAPSGLRERVLAALPGPDDAFLADPDDRARVLLRSIAREDDPVPARRAIEHLGRLGRPESLPVLLETLTREDRRVESIRALARLGDARAIPALEAYLEDPAAVAAVVRIGGDEAAGALCRAIEERAAAADEAPLLDALAGLSGTGAARALLGLARDPDRHDAIVAAMAARRGSIVPRLLDFAAGRDDEIADAALEALAALRPPEAVPVLRMLLADRERRAAAARALARIGTREAGRALLSRPLADDVRAAFAGAGAGVEEILIAELRAPHASRRARAVELLGACGGSRAVRALRPLADVAALSGPVFDALVRIGGTSAIETLADLAAAPTHRRAVVAAFSEIGGAEAVVALLDVARLDRKTRRLAFAALERMEPEVVVPALHGLGDDALGGAARRTLIALDAGPPSPPTSNRKSPTLY